MAATDALRFQTYAQATRLSGSIVSTSTGNPITGGLTVLTGSVSIDGGAFASTGVTATEIGTTGYFFVDIDATRMTGNTIIVKVTASNANAKEWSSVQYPIDLRERTGVFWLDQTVKRLEQGMVYESAFVYNLHTVNQSTETVYGRDGTTILASASISGVASASSTQTRGKMS